MFSERLRHVSKICFKVRLDKISMIPDGVGLLALVAVVRFLHAVHPDFVPEK